MQKKNDCWWFGEVGMCRNFYILIVFVSVCAVADFSFNVVMIWSGDTSAGVSGNVSGEISESSTRAKWKYRYAVAAG
jgi:hypothetical protein